MIQLTNQAIDPTEVLRTVQSPAAGAVVLFLGTVRADEDSDGRKTIALDYECYPEMAAQEIQRLEQEARNQWRLSGCAIVHRWGRLDVGQISVAVAVSAAHRQAAFAAAEWLIDRIKAVVPIWKQACFDDGSRQWIHPGLNAASELQDP